MTATAQAYDQVWDGAWIDLPRKGLKLACCDCLLVHDIEFRVRKGGLQARFERNNRATGQLRRHRPHNQTQTSP